MVDVDDCGNGKDGDDSEGEDGQDGGDGQEGERTDLAAISYGAKNGYYIYVVDVDIRGVNAVDFPDPSRYCQ